MDKNKKIENEEVEDTTKYGEFISSYFAWLTPEKQKNKAKEMNNMTKNHYVQYEGNTYTLSTLAKYLDIPYNIVRYRLSNCRWTVEQLINYGNDRN